MKKVCLRDQYEERVTTLIREMENLSVPSTTSTFWNGKLLEWVEELKDIRYYIQTTDTPEVFHTHSTDE